MIPLRDSVRPRVTPWVNYTLILLNIFIFYKEVTLPPHLLELFITRFSLIPANIPSINWNNLFNIDFRPLLTLLTSIFLHGNLLHIGGNMLYLWVFGDNVEDRLGHIRYLFFYLATGVIGNLCHVYFNCNSLIPTIGASGAVAGVMGAYFLAFPKARILTLVPVFFFITITQVRAIFFLFLWFFLQLLNGLTSFGLGDEAQMVAWWAHIGGFIAGALGYLLLRKRKATWNRLY